MTDDDRRELCCMIELLDALRTIRDTNPGRGQVTQLEHSLQTANLARQAGADDELILVALLHDAGKPLSMTRHGEVIAEILTGRVSDWAVAALREHGDHQTALLHDSSILISRWPEDARRLARWDAAAFNPDHHAPPLTEYLPLLQDLYDNRFKP